MYHSCQIPKYRSGKPDDVQFKSNVLIEWCILSWYIIEFKSFNKTIVDFSYGLTQDVIITSVIGLGNYPFFWVDKSLCQPYQKSLIVYNQY